MKALQVCAVEICLLYFCSCSPPLHREQIFGRTHRIVPIPAFLIEKTPFRGTGKVEYAVEGERLSAWFDIHYREDESLSATIYSPFGNILGYIDIGNDSGNAVIQGKQYDLSKEPLLDTFFHSSLTGFSLKEFVFLLCGRIIIPADFLNRPPDSIKTIKNENVYIWFEPQGEINLFFSKRFGKIKRIIIKAASEKENKHSIIYDSFSKRFVRIITFKVDDRNYFSIKYERFYRETKEQ